MSSVFAKLNLKGQPEILVLDPPASFEPELDALQGVRVLRDLRRCATVGFALVFVTRQEALDAVSAAVAAKAEGDALLWFAYPKKTSKRYACEFNRDTGWDVLRAHGFDTVRQVAIDEDWSALRVRRLEYIGR